MAQPAPTQALRLLVLAACACAALLISTASGCSDDANSTPCTTNSDCVAPRVCLTTSGACILPANNDAADTGTDDAATADVCTPSAEVCDGIDNDCDGLTDEDITESCSSVCGGGVRTCSNGVFGVCSARDPVDELCNGRDDDCDGEVDEGYALDQACATGVGACSRNGRPECNDAGELVCVGPVGDPTVEVCDGIDNDCNGLVDDAFGGGGPCAVGQGVCRAEGVTVCEEDADGNQDLICDATPGNGSPEVCDGLDNNCDGQTDEGLAGCDP